MKDMDELGAAYLRFIDARELIRGCMQAMCSIEQYETYSTAFKSVQAAIDILEKAIPE